MVDFGLFVYFSLIRLLIGEEIILIRERRKCLVWFVCCDIGVYLSRGIIRYFVGFR